MANRRGKSRNNDRFYFTALQNHSGPWLQPWNSKTLAPWKESYDKPRQHIRKQRHHFASKGLYSQLVFPVVMYRCESFLDYKEVKAVSAKENQSWIFIGRTNAEAAAPILLATWCGEPTHWERAWCWKRLRVGGEVGDRGWDGYIVSLTQWT